MHVLFADPSTRTKGLANRLAAVLACILCALAPCSLSAAANIASVPPVQPLKFSFSSLGSAAMELHGIQSTGSVNVGTRMDAVVTGAKLRLRMTYSPSMLPDLSHLRISLNGQVLVALPLPKELAGREVEREVDLDPRYFSDYNQIRFDLIGHYTLECEDPTHSSLWLNISPRSELELSVRPLELRNDLALLPAPFFDRRDSSRLVLPMVLPAQPTTAMVHAAGIAASWFGMMADYRSARFPVNFDTLPDRHALVFATNQSRPTSLHLGEVSQPTISIIDHPNNPLIKLLVFQGRDVAQLEQAVAGLALGNAVFTGNVATVSKVNHAPRKAYDAPRWLRTDRPVKLGELLDYPEQLQANGISPAPISINLRLPPDLFTWNRAGVPVDLRYRYTAPHDSDNSLLSISVNNQLLRSYRLRPESERGSDGKLMVPLLQTSNSTQREDLLIPAFQLASNNQMQFQFSLESHRAGLCKEISTDVTREAIDPDSTIDISDFPHYTAMPNLALFANAGYPFTRYADLAQTAIVLPDVNDRGSLEQLFFVLGRLGRHTGAVAASYQLLNVEQASKANDVDLLLLSGPKSNSLLKRWGKDVALVMDDAERQFRDVGAAPKFSDDRTANPARNDAEITVNASGALGAFISFESPLSAGRTVVALSASNADAATLLSDVLEDDGKVPLIRGDVAVVRGGNITSLQGDALYYVGKLSWWKWLWFHLSRHPVILTLLAMVMAIGVALLLYGWLQRRTASRLASNQG